MNTRRKFMKSTSLLAASAGVFGYQAVHSGSNNEETNIKKGNMMLHNVYFWLNEGVTDFEKKSFRRG